MDLKCVHVTLRISLLKNGVVNIKFEFREEQEKGLVSLFNGISNLWRKGNAITIHLILTMLLELSSVFKITSNMDVEVTKKEGFFR